MRIRRTLPIIVGAAVLLGAGCGRGLDSRPAPSSPGAPGADAAIADGSGAGDGAVDAPVPAGDRGRLEGGAPDGMGTVAPVYPPGGGSAPSSSCGTIGVGPVTALAVARDRPVVVVGHSGGQAAAYSSDDVTPIGGPARHLTPVTVVVVSADGSLVASGSRDGEVIIAATTGGRPTRRIKQEPGVGALALSPDAAVLVTVGAQAVRAWRVSDGAMLWLRPAEGDGRAIAFSLDGQTLIGGHRVAIFRRSSDGVVIRQLPLRDRPVITDVSTDGSLFVGQVPSVPFGMAIVGLWRASDGAPTWTRPLTGRIDELLPAVLSPDGSRVALADPGGTIRLLRAADGSEAGSVQVPRTSALAFAAGGDRLVVGDHEGGVRVLAGLGGQEQASVPGRPGHRSTVSQVAFSPDGTLFASSSYDRRNGGEGDDQSLRVWRVSDGRLLYTLPGAGGQTSQAFAFSPDSRLIASINVDGRLHLSRSSDGQEVASFGDGVLKLAFAPDGQTVLTDCSCRGERRPLRPWRVPDGGEEVGLGDPSQSPSAFAYSPDGAVVAVAARDVNWDTQLSLWRVSDGTRLWQVTRERDPVFFGNTGAVTFSPDGMLIAHAAFLIDHAEVRVHRRNDGHLVTRLEPKAAAHAGSAYGGAISFSHDGAWLAAGSDGELGGGLTLYRTSTWAAQPPLPGSFLGVAFSPVEDRLLGGGRDRVLRMFCGITGMLR